ncbi:hypothetical protein M0804_003596 [Polistes exclamans]|nr:hypothetical protein M0804_003596 [Polistes exclamans]
MEDRVESLEKELERATIGLCEISSRANYRRVRDKPRGSYHPFDYYYEDYYYYYYYDDDDDDNDRKEPILFKQSTSFEPDDDYGVSGFETAMGEGVVLA